MHGTLCSGSSQRYLDVCLIVALFAVHLGLEIP